VGFWRLELEEGCRPMALDRIAPGARNVCKEAMRNGASDPRSQELIEELRRPTDGLHCVSCTQRRQKGKTAKQQQGRGHEIDAGRPSNGIDDASGTDGKTGAGWRR